MASFSTTDVAFSGFRFVREHPRTAVLWGAIHPVISILFGALMVEMAGPALTRLMALRAEHSRDPAEIMAATQALAPFYLAVMLYGLIFYAVLYAAVSRAVLRPGEDRFGYLRLGMDEVRQILLILLCVVVGVAAYVAAALVVIIVGVGLALLARAASSGFGTFAAIAAVVAMIAVVCAMVFVWVRLSLASPLTFDQRRVNLFGSWRLTSGRFWTLFGCYLLVLVLTVVVWFLFLIVSAAVVAVLGGGLAAMSLLFQPDMSSLGAYFSPARFALLAIWSLSAGLFWPVLLMPQAEIYRRLTADQPAGS